MCDLKFTQLLLVRIEVRARDSVFVSLEVSLQERVLLQGQREHFDVATVGTVSRSVIKIQYRSAWVSKHDNFVSFSSTTGNNWPFVLYL